MTKTEWQKTRRSLAGIWRHTSGFEVRHCGHPTANWPYYVLSTAGEMFVHPCGYAFRLLAEAQDAVERFLKVEKDALRRH